MQGVATFVVQPKMHRCKLRQSITRWIPKPTRKNATSWPQQLTPVDRPVLTARLLNQATQNPKAPKSHQSYTHLPTPDTNTITSNLKTSICVCQQLRATKILTLSNILLEAHLVLQYRYLKNHIGCWSFLYNSYNHTGTVPALQGIPILFLQIRIAKLGC